MTPDSINAAFELGGAFILLLNLRQLRRDREVKGIDWRAVVFFTAWGVWNCWFYAVLNAPVSAACAGSVVLVNSIWLAHLGWYTWTSQQLIHNPDAVNPSRIAT